MDDDEEVFGVWNEEEAAEKQMVKDARRAQVLRNQLALLKRSITFYPQRIPAPDAAPSKKRTAPEATEKDQHAKRFPRQAKPKLEPEEVEHLENQVKAMRAARQLYDLTAEGMQPFPSAVNFYQQCAANSAQAIQENRRVRRNHRSKPKEP